jgi:RHS repeat-associated protein
MDGTGTLLGRMDYSPFGQLIAQYKFTPTGNNTLARLPFGFSTKYTDAESGLLYYGYRYYNMVAGRWLNRDPIGERGGRNLYSFIRNSGVNFIDFQGLRLHKYEGGTAPVEELADTVFDNFYNSSTNKKVDAVGVYLSGWPTEIAKCDKCILKVEGNYQPKIYIKQGWQNKVGADGTVVSAHEQEHDKIAAAVWNKLVDAANPLENIPLQSEECCLKYAEHLNLAKNVFKAAESLKNALYDQTQYGGGDVARAKLELDKAQSVLAAHSYNCN